MATIKEVCETYVDSIKKKRYTNINKPTLSDLISDKNAYSLFNPYGL